MSSLLGNDELSGSDGFTRLRMMTFDLLTKELFIPQLSHFDPSPIHALVVVRMHRRPIGSVTIRVDTEDESEIASLIMAAAHAELHEEIAAHLATDGIAPTAPLSVSGLVDELACRIPYLTPGSTGPKVTVVIPTVNNEAACLETIEHVLRSQYDNFEIVVVENTPRPTKLRELIQNQMGESSIRVVHESRKGSSRARNLGLKNVHSDFVIFIDDDVIVDRYWMAALMAGFVNNKKVMCVTGAILPREIETPAQSWLEQYGGYHKGYEPRLYDLQEHRDDDPLYPYAAGKFGSGANMAFRVDALQRLGGFCNELGAGVPAHGGEDIDLLRRVISSGGTLLYEPGAMVWHAHRRSNEALRTQMYRYGVGLSATMTKWVLEDSSVARDFLRRIPQGLKYLLNPVSGKNMHKGSAFPSELSRREMIGFAMGPFHYFRSYLAVRRNRSSPRGA